MKNAINKEIKELLERAEKNLKDMELWATKNIEHANKVADLINDTEAIINECKEYLEPELPSGIEEKEQLTKEQKEDLI